MAAAINAALEGFSAAREAPAALVGPDTCWVVVLYGRVFAAHHDRGAGLLRLYRLFRCGARGARAGGAWRPRRARPRRGAGSHWPRWGCCGLPLPTLPLGAPRLVCSCMPSCAPPVRTRLRPPTPAPAQTTLAARPAAHPPPAVFAAPACCRDATSLAHSYEVYAQQLELSVVDNVLLVRPGLPREHLWRRAAYRQNAPAAARALRAAPAAPAIPLLCWVCMRWREWEVAGPMRTGRELWRR